MEIPVIETPAVCIPSPEETPRKKTGRPRQHANATERKRAQRARDKSADAALGVPIKAPKKKIHGTDANRARAYRVKKAIAEHRQYRPKIEPPGPEGTQSDWNRYLESVGLGLKAGEAESVPTNFKGGLMDLQDIDTAHQFETQAEGYIARRTPSSGNSSGEDD